MQTGYQPKGRAREYSELALNIYTGCSNGCTYCFNRNFPWYKEAVFNNPVPRPGMLKELEKYCEKREGDPREILLCFTCDPYPAPPCDDITRQVLLILEEYKMRAQVLTKGGTRACRDFDILGRNNWKFGSTITLCNEGSARIYEPHAALYSDRKEAILRAREAGVYTWVSLEPVIDPEQAIFILEDLMYCVDYWKIGKLNHHPEIEKTIDWAKFLSRAQKILGDKPHLIKKDLRAAAEKEAGLQPTTAAGQNATPLPEFRNIGDRDGAY